MTSAAPEHEMGQQVRAMLVGAGSVAFMAAQNAGGGPFRSAQLQELRQRMSLAGERGARDAIEFDERRAERALRTEELQGRIANNAAAAEERVLRIANLRLQIDNNQGVASERALRATDLDGRIANNEGAATERAQRMAANARAGEERDLRIEKLTLDIARARRWDDLGSEIDEVESQRQVIDPEIVAGWGAARSMAGFSSDHAAVADVWDERLREGGYDPDQIWADVERHVAEDPQFEQEPLPWPSVLAYDYALDSLADFYGADYFDEPPSDLDDAAEANRLIDATHADNVIGDWENLRPPSTEPPVGLGADPGAEAGL